MDISIYDIIYGTMTDGVGYRTSIYCCGCPNKCKGCHNPQTWDIDNGRMVSTDELLDNVMSDEFADVTFSGGDPMFQPVGFAELAEKIKRNTDKTIWCYTGFTFENLIKGKDTANLLKYIDVLVDGRFVEELKDEDLLFRGSSNQRLIDVQESLKEGKTVLFDYRPTELC